MDAEEYLDLPYAVDLRCHRGRSKHPPACQAQSPRAAVGVIDLVVHRHRPQPGGSGEPLRQVSRFHPAVEPTCGVRAAVRRRAQLLWTAGV